MKKNYVEAEVTSWSDNPDGPVEQVAVKLTIEWPEDKGFNAYIAAFKIGDHADELAKAVLSQTVFNGDKSILAELDSFNGECEKDAE